MSHRNSMKEKGLIEVHGVWVRPEHKELIKSLMELSKLDLLSEQTTELIKNLIRK